MLVQGIPFFARFPCPRPADEAACHATDHGAATTRDGRGDAFGAETQRRVSSRSGSLNPRITRFRKMLAQATNYEQWKAAALELDFLEGNAEWKEDFASDLYHYELIYDRLSNLKQ